MKELLKNAGAISERKSLVYFRQMIEAFRVLTKRHIVHGDISPKHILLHNGNIKIIGIGNH